MLSSFYIRSMFIAFDCAALCWLIDWLDKFPRSFPVDVEVANLLRIC